MPASLTLFLQHDWPLLTIVAAMSMLVVLALVCGYFPTNQGRIRRTDNPSAYWRWVARFSVLLAVACLALLGSYFSGAN